MKSVKEQIPAALMPATAYRSEAKDFFAKQSVNDAWESSATKEYGPVNIIEDEKICFAIPKLDSSTFMYLGEAKFAMQLALEDKDGQPPPAKDSEGNPLTLAPAALFPSTMINGVKMWLNETQVATGGGNLYEFWGYTDAVLNRDREEQDSDGNAYGMFLDAERDFYEDYTLDGAVKYTGWEGRKRQFGHYREVLGHDFPVLEDFEYDGETRTFYAKLLSDFSSNRRQPLPPQVSVRLEVILNRPGFYLQSSQPAFCEKRKFRLKIKSIKLQVPVKKLKWSEFQEYESRLKREPVEFFLQRQECSKILLSKGERNFSISGIKQGQLVPDRILLMLVNGWALDKNYGKSPFMSSPEVFLEEHAVGKKRRVGRRGCSLTSLKMMVNNTIVNDHVNATDHDELVKQLFEQTHGCFGAKVLPTCPNISLDHFKNGTFICAFDLTKGKRFGVSGHQVRQLPRVGDIRLDLGFDEGRDYEPDSGGDYDDEDHADDGGGGDDGGKVKINGLPTDAFLLVLSTYHSRVSIDSERNVNYRYID